MSMAHFPAKEPEVYNSFTDTEPVSDAFRYSTTPTRYVLVRVPATLHHSAAVKECDRLRRLRGLGEIIKQFQTGRFWCFKCYL